MVFGWFYGERSTVLLRGQCHAHLFFCKKPARLQLSLCARSSKLSSQQHHQCSYSLCTASNSTLAPVSSRHRQPQPLELLLSQPPPLESASIFEAARFCCTYCCYCLWCATMYQEGLFPSMPLVFQCTYTTIRSGSLGCVLTAQGCTKGSWAVGQPGSRAAGQSLLAKLASFCNMTRLVNAMAVHLYRSKADRSKLIHFSCTALQLSSLQIFVQNLAFFMTYIFISF